jgi:hypothetical protein
VRNNINSEIRLGDGFTPGTVTVAATCTNYEDGKSATGITTGDLLGPTVPSS